MCVYPCVCLSICMCMHVRYVEYACWYVDMWCTRCTIRILKSNIRNMVFRLSVCVLPFVWCTMMIFWLRQWGCEHFIYMKLVLTLITKKKKYDRKKQQQNDLMQKWSGFRNSVYVVRMLQRWRYQHITNTRTHMSFFYYNVIIFGEFKSISLW